jgi:hypothetical protein
VLVAESDGLTSVWIGQVRLLSVNQKFVAASDHLVGFLDVLFNIFVKVMSPGVEVLPMFLADGSYSCDAVRVVPPLVQLSNYV